MSETLQPKTRAAIACKLTIDIVTRLQWLWGKDQSGVRQEIMSALFGVKIAKANCGINALLKEFYRVSKIAGCNECEAIRQHMVWSWIKQYGETGVEPVSIHIPQGYWTRSGDQWTAEEYKTPAPHFCPKCHIARASAGPCPACM